MQSALTKERKELKQQQQASLVEAIPVDVARAWNDPMAKPGERQLADSLRNIGASLTAGAPGVMPAWKVAAGGKDVAFGQRYVITSTVSYIMDLIDNRIELADLPNPSKSSARGCPSSSCELSCCRQWRSIRCWSLSARRAPARPRR
jgi:hypothetical protein